MRQTRAKLGISNLPQFPDVGQNSERGIPGFCISGQSLMKEISRTSDDIDMKFRPVTKLGKRNKKTAVSDLWPIWSNSAARFLRHSL